MTKSPNDQMTKIHNHLLSLCGVCFLQNRQYLLSSSRSVVFFRFFDVL